MSQHPGDFVIARDQIEQLVPVENASMKNRSAMKLVDHSELLQGLVSRSRDFR